MTSSNGRKWHKENFWEELAEIITGMLGFSEARDYSWILILETLSFFEAAKLSMKSIKKRRRGDQKEFVE